MRADSGANGASEGGIGRVPIGWRRPARGSGVGRHGGEGGKSEVAPKRDTTEAKELRNKLEIAFLLEFKERRSDELALGSGYHFGDGASRVVVNHRKAPDGWDILENREWLQSAGVGTCAVEVDGVKSTKTVAGDKFDEQFEEINGCLH